MDYTELTESRKLSIFAWVVLAILFVGIISTTFYFKDTFFGADNLSKKSEYQAIFLANGQVYFGKITSINKDFVVLENIYYLQAVQPLQGASAESQPFSLIKLGKELHGPTDIMYINKSQILFYEDLREDSSVVKTIMESKP